jgi:hypothetical protein
MPAIDIEYFLLGGGGCYGGDRQNLYPKFMEVSGNSVGKPTHRRMALIRHFLRPLGLI